MQEGNLKNETANSTNTVLAVVFDSIYLCKSLENIKGEIFVDIKGYEGLYQISNYGRIKALNWKGVGLIGIRKQQIDKDGYLRCNLIKDGKNKCFIIHQLIGKHFLNLIKDKPHINHIDGNKLNNISSNLEWCNISENNNLALKLGLLSKGGRKYKKIIAEDCLGNIKEFNSIKDAILKLRFSNTDYHNISACCNGKKKEFNNYKWRYL